MSLASQIQAELQAVHVRQQAGRFLRLLSAAVVVQVGALGTGHLTRDALVGAGVAAVEVAYRQWVAVVPWREIAERLHILESAQTAAGDTAPLAESPLPTLGVPLPPIAGGAE